MTRIFYDGRCRCKEDVSLTKKRELTHRSEGKSFLYPDSDSEEFLSKTFQIKYEKKLSLLARFVFNTFRNKYVYYAIDDILYLLKSDLVEQKDLLTILYSPIISLQNTLSINFFDIWIQEIDINDISRTNKFLNTNNYKVESTQYITIKFLYRIKAPTKKQEPLW